MFNPYCHNSVAVLLNSIPLQLVCDDNMVFRDVLVGWPGSVHDCRILRNSSLLETAANKFTGDSHLLGDGGYPLKRFVFQANCKMPKKKV